MDIGKYNKDQLQLPVDIKEPLDIKSPVFKAEPGWGGQLKRWFSREPGSVPFFAVLVLILIVEIYLLSNSKPFLDFLTEIW
ncbi:MAG: hypothetical protein A3B99_00750 [Candidatus Yanofskybacteria bacterium RIFCSPHIGHO2_02_FULL_44_12b]|uniref:Uncharacterized protein n=2 Tax=Candidatus Yanofskyibacteriota TaxID=1752733 RepID=A0A1F8GJD9_9BACT|nr:MAG: hypothetical protein UW79_C0004G0014 [Candidatus Yanofskybacteria bacterium GW2011_GWA2_44_9]OGN05346.1 MAG: hypothetical protein A2659_01950 [Candidatus Yanofskybacteria bacterium RIFCSPHIGHO2_01_FULL_44_24]OGN16004.1 MAG: hypothetical protein A3B99_00750 [Candidatus Yanofskybacteria bacterium RIFCSPHIGHO2_02_FULL_44_12b]OGN25515.1 MAG: hypothetical protein A2925_02195 [Candidatus Yanofskybacteria bacterium RIFCSPLOWO2_01_FULL_44_22]